MSTSGWRRQGVVGETHAALDLDLVLPSTGERAFVPVESKTDSAELADCVGKFEALRVFDRMFFAFHPGDARTDDERVTAIGPDTLAETTMEAGLANWLLRKVSERPRGVRRIPSRRTSIGPDGTKRRPGNGTVPAGTLCSIVTPTAEAPTMQSTCPPTAVTSAPGPRKPGLCRGVARLLAALAASLGASAGTAWGHDLWLVPPAEGKANAATEVLAVSGTEFPKGDHAPNPAKFATRRVVGPTGVEATADAAGTRDKAGLLTFTAATPGVYALAVETTPKLLTLEAPAFNDYLVSDGLAHIYRLRSREKSLDRPGVERYSKSPKCLVRVGDGRAGDPCRPVGLPLEIVPLADPFGRKPGDTLKVRVLFRGKPLADARLGWSHPGGGEEPDGTVRTAADGEAYVPIARAGLMTVRLTYMTRPKAADHEWESFWTTLTFRLPE